MQILHVYQNIGLLKVCNYHKTYYKHSSIYFHKLYLLLMAIVDWILKNATIFAKNFTLVNAVFVFLFTVNIANCPNKVQLHVSASQLPLLCSCVMLSEHIIHAGKHTCCYQNVRLLNQYPAEHLNSLQHS